VEPAETIYPSETDEITVKVSLFTYLYRAIKKEIRVDYDIGSIATTYQLWDEDGKVITQGDLEWDNGEQQFVAKIPTEIDGESLGGKYQLVVFVDPESENYVSSDNIDAEFSLVFLGTTEAIPGWFWPLLFSIIGAAVAMAGYGIRKALYLRIPFVLRKIDETVKKIEKDKYPAVGVMTGRDEFIINSIIDNLEECGIEWEREDKFEIKKVGETGVKEELPPLTVDEIEVELEQITEISAEEKMLFKEELKQLDRDAQEEFLKSLRGE
jgi:hypothetical protein